MPVEKKLKKIYIEKFAERIGTRNYKNNIQKLYKIKKLTIFCISFLALLGRQGIYPNKERQDFISVEVKIYTSSITVHVSTRIAWKSRINLEMTQKTSPTNKEAWLPSRWTSTSSQSTSLLVDYLTV